MKLRLGCLVVAACAALFLGGCSTVQTRISEHPDLYQSLSASDQALVTQGQIRTGMSTNSVWLAWGAPDQKGVGQNGRRPVETWIYYGTTDAYPGFGPGFYGGFGGYGGFGYLHRGGYYHRRFYYDPFYDPFFYNRLSIVRYPERFVSFENVRVVAYNFLPPPRYY